MAYATPQQILEKIRNNQEEHCAAFERLYRHPNNVANDYHDPLAPVAAGAQAVRISRPDALTIYEGTLLAPAPAGQEMTDCQANLVQRWRPAYNTRRNDRSASGLGITAAVAGLAAVLYASCMVSIEPDQKYVEQRYFQRQKIERSITVDDVVNETRDSNTRGQRVFQIGGALVAAAGVLYALLRRRQQ